MPGLPASAQISGSFAVAPSSSLRDVESIRHQYARIMRRFQLGVVIAASVLLTAACRASGPQGPRLSHEQFVKQMHSICRPVNAMRGQFGDPAYDKQLLNEGRGELAQLRKLNPPKTDEDRLSDAFRHWSSALDDFEDLARAAESKDR